MPDISPGRMENSPQGLGKLTLSQCMGVAEHLTTGFLTESHACPCRTCYAGKVPGSLEPFWNAYHLQGPKLEFAFFSLHENSLGRVSFQQ